MLDTNFLKVGKPREWIRCEFPRVGELGKLGSLNEMRLKVKVVFGDVSGMLPRVAIMV